LLWRAVELSRGMERQNKRALAIVREALLPVLAIPGAYVFSDGQALDVPQPGDDGTASFPIRVNSKWQAIHQGVLEALLGASTRTMAHQEAWRAAAAILCHHSSHLAEDRQQWLFDTLKVACKYTDQNVLRGPGPPPLVNLIAIQASPRWLQPVDVKGAAASTIKGPFIFSAFDARAVVEKKKIRWVCNENCKVDVEVSNPCSIPINVERMFLAGFYEDEIVEAGGRIPYPKPQDHSGWKGTAVTVWLPAHTPPSRLSLTGLAKKPGRIVITGCYVQMFGVTWHQPWLHKYGAGEMLSDGMVSGDSKANSNDWFRPLTVEVVPPLQLMHGVFKGDRLTAERGGEEEGGEEALRSGKPMVQHMVAYEGEILIWTLVLTNVGQQDITSVVAQVTVQDTSADQSKQVGRAGRRPPVAVDLKQDAIQAHLPLPPGMSMDVPVTVQVGKGRCTSETRLQVHVQLQYLGDSQIAHPSSNGGPVPAEASEAQCVEASTQPKPSIGRSLDLDVNLTVQRMLKINSCSFFTRDILSSPKEPALAEAEGIPRTASQCCMELDVENSGGLAYKAWVGPWPGGVSQEVCREFQHVPPRGGKARVVGAVKVPGDIHQGIKNWGLHWEQARVDASSHSSSSTAADGPHLPRGFLPLERETIEASMSPAVANALSQPAVEVEYSVALLDRSEAPKHLPIRCVQDLLQETHCHMDDSLRPSTMLGCKLSVGSVIKVATSVFNRIDAGLSVSMPLACSRMRGVVPSPGPHQHMGLQDAAADELMWMVIGTMSCPGMELSPNSSDSHSFGLCFTAPGMYEIGTSMIQLESGYARDSGAAPAKAFPISERKLHVLVVE